MAEQLIECPKCGKQNDAAAETCSKCGIHLAWALEHWSEVVSGPEDHDAPLILYVDDEGGALTLVGIILNRAGYRVAKAHDGYEALDLIPRLMPDLIITDINMPGMDGIELIYQLKASPTLQNIPVFILSVRADPNAIQLGLDAGAVEYLIKPTLSHDLIAAVSSVLPPLASHEHHQS